MKPFPESETRVRYYNYCPVYVVLADLAEHPTETSIDLPPRCADNADSIAAFGN